MKNTIQHLNASGCVLDFRIFETEGEMDNYILNFILPTWQEGDTIVCDGSAIATFDNVPLQLNFDHKQDFQY